MPLKVPILCYHRVHRDDDCPPTPHAGAYCGHVSLSAFQRQMQYLAQERFTTVTHRDLAEWLLAGRSLPERAVAVDFDDNRIHVMENACPVQMTKKGAAHPSDRQAGVRIGQNLPLSV